MRPLLVRCGALATTMTSRLAGLAIVSVRADEHAPALVVGDDLVEIGIAGAAPRAWRVKAVARERVILEIERHHVGVRRDRVDPLFASGAEQLQRRTIVHLRI